MKSKGFWVFPAFVGLILVAVLVVDVVEYFTAQDRIEPVVPNSIRQHFSAPCEGFDFVKGWSKTESKGRWATGSAAQLRAHVDEPTARTLAFDCRPYHDSTIVMKQSIVITVNEKIVGRVELEPRSTIYSIKIPQDVLHYGFNDIELEFAYHNQPGNTAQTRSRRKLAVFFRWMALVE